MLAEESFPSLSLSLQLIILLTLSNKLSQKNWKTLAIRVRPGEGNDSSAEKTTKSVLK